MSGGRHNGERRMIVRLTGEIGVTVHGEPAPLRGVKQLALLARLALDVGSTVPRERLLDDLWEGQRLESGSGALRVQVNRLRKALEKVGMADAIITEPDGYRLDLSRAAVDVFAAEDKTTEALTLADRDPAAAVECYEDASRLITGLPLVGLEDFAFAREATSQISMMVSAGRRQWARAMVQSGDPEAAVALLDGQVLLDPLDSGAVVQLMQAYRATGRPHLALQVAGDHRQELLAAGLSVTDALVEEEQRALGGAEDGHRRPALIGREPECALVGAAVSGLESGHGSVLLLTGSPGVGKTALLDWVSDRFGEPSARTMHRGSGDRLEADLPLQVIRDLFSEVPEVTMAIDRAMNELAERTSSPAGSETDSAPDWARLAASNDLIDVLRAAISAPVVLLVDDVHWADESSLHVLRRLARLSVQLPIVIVAAGRPKERGDWRDQLAVGRAQFVALESLDVETSVRLAQSILEEDVNPLARRAIEQTGGLPLLVVELARSLRSGVGLVEAGGRIVLAGSETPDSFLELVRSRLDDLSPEIMEVCQGVAILGRHATMERLAALVERRPLVVVRHVQTASDRGVLGTTGARVEFRHDIIREAVDGGIASASRPILHRHAAEILAAGGAPVTSVAAHAAIASASEGDSDVVEWLRQAADQTSALEPSTALVFLDRALSLAVGMQARYEIQRAKVEALISAGRMSEASELLQNLLAMHPTHKPELSIRLAGLQMLSHQSPQALETVAAALDVDPGAATRARLLAVSSLISLNQLDCEIASETALAADALGAQVGDLPSRSIACGMLGRLRSFDYQTKEGLRYARMAVEFAEADVTGEAHTYQPWSVLAMSALDMDAHQDVERATEEGIRRAREFYAPWSEPIYRILGASLAYRRGQLDQVVATSEEILAHQNDVGLGPVDSWAEAFLSLIATRVGDADRAAHHAKVAEEAAANSSNPLGGDFVMMATALADAAQGKTDEAIDNLRAGWDLFDAINVRTCLPVLAPTLARLSVAGHREDAAVGVVDECALVAQRTGVVGYRALANRVRGIIDADAGALEVACTLYAKTERHLDLFDTRAELRAVREGGDLSRALG